MTPNDRLTCSVLVTAHNEEANIGRLLAALASQQLATVEIAEIIVVASGCSDGTEAIVREAAEHDPRVSLLVQPTREGKTSAINLFLRHAASPIVVVQSGDTLPRSDSIEHLVRPFHDASVGMTGAQKVPVNATDTFIGYFSHLRLQLEHQLALEIPRLGELIAFRNLLDKIPEDVAMDEAFMEYFILGRGLRVVYAPNAVVLNMGPQTVGDFIKQRRRNHAGHLHLRHKYGHKVSSLNTRQVARIAAGEVWRLASGVFFLAFLAGLEGYARMLGSWDYYVRRRPHTKWDIAWTTKRVDIDHPDAVQGFGSRRSALGDAAARDGAPGAR
jgi:cellulose synthase/poly-beta-1,6-N-acetylglucosamine synthase-like glycosyltransferase